MYNLLLMRRICLFALVILAAFGQVRAGNDALMRFAGNIHQFNELFPQEKVYLQFDNTAYFQGETIWFKAFVVKSSDLNRAPSTVLYVDLVSPNGVLLRQQKLKIVAGQADGCIELLDNSTGQARELRGILPYPSGYYEIRAYTQYMLNFGDDIIFSRVLPVYKTPGNEGDYTNPVMAPDSTILSQKRPAQEKLRKVNVSFYPEGGHLVRDLMCRVAFKATDENGKGINGSLSLTGDDGMQITAESGHEGMGSFVFTPGSGKANALFEYQGKKYSVTLPAPQPAGYSIMADNVSQENRLKLSVRHSVARKERTVGLTVTCRGELVMFQELAMKEDGDNRFELDTKDWPAGVCRLVLFTDRGEVLAARSIYNGNTKYQPPVIDFKTDKRNYEAFGKMKLSLDLKDRNGKPFRDRFCLSVRDAADYGTAYSDNLLTDFLLTSDLKGFIHDPEYYFRSGDKTHLNDLDLLCMVQGWERYDWEYMTDNRVFHENKRLEDSLSLNGWIMTNRLTKDRAIDNVRIYVAVVPHSNGNIELGQAVTGKDGYFGFNMKDFYGKADLTMRIANADKTDHEPKAKIRMDRAYTPAVRAYSKEELQPGWSVRNPRTAGNDLADNKFPAIISESEGLVLPAVNIDEKLMYVDYFTFKAFDVDKDVETELDFGNYTTDVMGYLIDKGYTVWCPGGGPVEEWFGVMESGGLLYPITDEASSSYYFYAQSNDLSAQDFIYLERIGYGARRTDNHCELNGHNVVWYVHDDKQYYRDGAYSTPWTIDVQDIEGIIVFDDLLSMAQIRQHAPLYAKYLDSSGMMAQFYNQASDARTHMLVDIKLKDASKILSKNDKLNLGKRVTTVQGFNRSHSFYAPEYPEGGIIGDADYRRTLYWNPNVVTDENGHAEIEFYNNSYSTRFNVSGAGITASGQPYVLDKDF